MAESRMVNQTVWSIVGFPANVALVVNISETFLQKGPVVSVRKMTQQFFNNLYLPEITL